MFSPLNIIRKIRAKRRERAHKEKLFHQGYEAFKTTGVTPDDAYYAMIDLYCLTDGRFNEGAHQELIKNSDRKKVSETNDIIFGNVKEHEFEKINATLNNDGYITFEAKLPKEMCDKLTAFAMNVTTHANGHKEKILFDPGHYVSEIYRIASQDCLNNETIQELIMNPALINMARNYLQCEPIFDFPAMWWSTSYKSEASEEAAQLFHFDLDRLKWLKIFFYINDVTAENGPHCYIRGSHKPGTKPAEVLQKGYARITDEELQKYYKKEDFIELQGPSGSVFAGDTRCWHKGKHLKSGHRLVFELEYTSSLFGSNYPKILVNNGTPAFKEFCKMNPIYASNIKFEN
jgi:hypothetical protein